MLERLDPSRRAFLHTAAMTTFAAELMRVDRAHAEAGGREPNPLGPTKRLRAGVL